MALSAIDLSHSLANAALANVARAQFVAGLKDAAGVNLRRAVLQFSRASDANRYIADATAHAVSLAYAAGGDFHSAERFARQMLATSDDEAFKEERRPWIQASTSRRQVPASRCC